MLQNYIFPHCHHHWLCFQDIMGLPKCAGLPGNCLVTHIAVVTPETCYPLTNAALILYLVSINVQQALININESNFFSVWRNSITYLLCKYYMSDVILQDYSFSSACSKGKKLINRKVQPVLSS